MTLTDVSTTFSGSHLQSQTCELYTNPDDITLNRLPEIKTICQYFAVALFDPACCKYKVVVTFESGLYPGL